MRKPYTAGAEHARHAMPDGKPPIDLKGTIFEDDSKDEEAKVPMPTGYAADLDDTAHGGNIRSAPQQK